MVIGGYDVAALATKTWSEIGKDKIALYAAQMAYSFFFALFPLMLFFAALLSLVVDKQTVMVEFNGRVAEALPGDVASLLGKTIENVIFAKGAPGLLSFGLLTAAWSGSSIFGALRAALNDAYHVEETRPWWMQYLVQLGMLIVAGVVIVASTVILLNGEGVIAWLGTRLGLERMTTLVWIVIQYPLAFAALIAVLWMLYYFLPDCRHQDKRVLIIGAMLATLLWIAATLLFRLYVQKFNQLNPAYGAIGAIMVLLTWMYYSSFVLLAVGELTAELQAGSGRVDRPIAMAPTSGAMVPRHYALVPSPRRPVPQDGGGRGHGWSALDWITPRIATRTKGALASARDWVEGMSLQLRKDIALACRDLGASLLAVSNGVLLCAAGAATALLGALSLITGLILLVGAQWLPGDRYVLGAFLVAVVAGVSTLAFTRRGLAMLTRR